AVAPCGLRRITYRRSSLPIVDSSARSSRPVAAGRVASARCGARPFTREVPPMRRYGSRVAVFLCCAYVMAGCGGGSPASPTANPPSSPATFVNLAGTWTGTVGGVTQGVTLAGVLTVTLQQNAGALSGGYAMEGTLTNPVQQTKLVGQVALTGTVAVGPNPAV